MFFKSNDPSTIRFKEILKVLKQHKITKDRSPENIRLIFEELGPTFVKIGQILSTREDLIPKEYTVEFEKLKENVSPLSFDVVNEIISTELLEKSKDLVDISTNPIGSASIGQVHTAKLFDKKVVIKVMRPNIYETAKNDVNLILKALKYLDLLPISLASIDFQFIIKEIWEQMEKEMDFKIEANNLLTMRKTYSEDNTVSFPEPFFDYTTSHVLVMEYIEGIKVDNLEELKNNGYNLEDLCNKLTENYLKQVIDNGFFHADPHSGNMIVSGGKIIWLDLGMVGILSLNDRLIFKKCIKAIVSKDAYELKQSILLLVTSKKPINHSQLYQDIESMMNRYASMDISSINMGDLLTEFLDLLKKHEFNIPKSISLLARSCLLLQKTVSILDNNLSIIEVLKDHVNILEDFDLKDATLQYTKDLYNSASKMAGIPGDVSSLINQVSRGEIEINTKISNIDELIKQKNKTNNKYICLSIVITNVVCFTLILCAFILIKPTTFIYIVAGIACLIMLGIITVSSLALLYSIYKSMKNR